MVRALRSWALAFLVATVCIATNCPGSPTFIHASCRVEVEVEGGCDVVVDEMRARVRGQYSSWHDPHSNGTYKILDQPADELLLSRTSGNGSGTLTDKVKFTFTGRGENCRLSGCSESQARSFVDLSTNYCNMRNLYCGSAEGCQTVVHNFAVNEISVRPSLGAGKDPSACVAAPTPPPTPRPTLPPTPRPTPRPTPPPTPPPSPSHCQNKKFDQCGGFDSEGQPWDKAHGHETCCPANTHCKAENPYYSHCVDWDANDTFVV